MKRLLLLLLLSGSFISASAQSGLWGCYNLITFDSGDNLYPVAIDIDANYHHNIWQIGTPDKTEFTSAYSFPNAIVTDTLNPYPVNDTSVFYLKIPSHLAYITYLSFYYELDIDSGAIARIDISEDNGGHWVNYMDSLPSCFTYNNGSPVNLSVSTVGWQYVGLYGNLYCADIPADTFLFRFTFISDDIPSTKDGWMIDNINIQLWCDSYTPNIKNKTPGPTFSVFPNPAYDNLTITYTDIITQLTITNLLGQTVYCQSPNANSQLAQIDVSSLPAGVYFVRVNNTDVKKFVKE